MDKEERGAPGAASICAVARDAEPGEEPLAAGGAARRPGRVEQGREARGEDTDRRDRENEDQQGAAHGVEDKGEIPLDKPAPKRIKKLTLLGLGIGSAPRPTKEADDERSESA